MAAAEARRRMKADLQAQLDRIAAQEEEEERYSRQSQSIQHDQQRSYQTQPQPTAGSSSRPDVISPTWPHSQVQYQQSQQNGWASQGNDRRNTTNTQSSSRYRDDTLPTPHSASHSAFRPLPEPTPMIISSGSGSGSGSAPWQRTGPSSTRPMTFTPPTPDATPITPNMPNPLSASFVNIPVPSKHQVQEYLVNRVKQPLGLGMGWSIDGHVFDVYDLLLAVVRLGGSATVSRREWWATLAVMLGIPPSINTPHGPRASVEAAKQLCAFFRLHLSMLETMWDETRLANETFGKSSAISHDQASGPRIRPPVSSARGDNEEPRQSTYPPPPPQHRESSSQSRHRSDIQYQPSTSTASSSMPLHVNPEPSSSGNGFTLQPPPSRKSQSSTAKQRQPSSNGVNGTSFTRGQPPSLPPSVSPVLHQPTPARLDSPAQKQPQPQRTTIDPRMLPLQNSSRSVPPAQAPPSQSQSFAPRPSPSQPKTLTVAPLAGYNPPKFASFDHLVATNALTLPKLPPNVVLNITGTESEVYAKRCFELRGVVKKIQAKEPARQVSKDEMTFWQKLLAILRHNPQVVIPGSQPMSTENAPKAPLTAAQSSSGSQAGPSNDTGTASPVDGSQPPKKKRGRPSNHDRQLADSGAIGPNTQFGPNGEILPGSQNPPLKKKRGPKLKPRPIIPNPESLAEGSTLPTPVATATATATTATTNGATSDTQTPKYRKPYTIRVGPDGKPLSERFKKRLVSGNLGPVEIVEYSQAALGQNGEAGPSTLQYAFAGAGSESDALGESDPDISRFEGPGGLAAFDAAIGYREDGDLPVEAALSQVAGSSTGPGTNGAATTDSNGVPVGPKVKNPKRVEASKRRWEQRRLKQQALRASQGFTSGSDIANGSQVAGSSSQPVIPKSRGGFAVPGNAVKAATKRWSLQHAALAAPSDSGTRVGVFRAVSSSPMLIASPKRIISLSGSGPSQRDRDTTPVRYMGADLLRQRAGSLKSRSSLPLHLTPSRRAWSPVQEQEQEPEVDNGGGDMMDSQDAPDLEDSVHPDLAPAPSVSTSKTPVSKVKASAKQTKGPRASLPNLGSMGPPLSTERPIRGDKGKAVGRTSATPDPASRSIFTRSEKSVMPEPSRLSSRHSLPSRASSVSLSQPNTRGRPDARKSTSPIRQTRAPSSQPRHRLIPEIELIISRRYFRLSPVRPIPDRREVMPIKVEPKARPKPRPLPVKFQPKAKTRTKPSFSVAQARLKANPKPKPKPKPSFNATQAKLKAIPKPRRPAVKYARVVLRIRKRRRAELIASGHYDPFRDDDSGDEGRTKRYGHSGLRPKVALPRGSQARTARPQAPEIVPARFVTRGIEPELEERYRPVLSEETILKRTNEQECGWKGCDAVLASEWHLKRHVDLRRHAAQAIFKAGIYGETTLYRCHWEDCEKPCFASLDGLKQHLTARHISRVLSCPYPDCGLMYSTLSHLTRHAVKHHDSPEDQAVPLADLSAQLPPPPFPDPPQHLPESARTDILTTPQVYGNIFRTLPRQEWCRLKVQNGSYAPDEPVLHIEHPPHILKPLDDERAGGELDADNDSDVGTVYTVLEGGIMTEERLLDESLGRPKRRLFPVVDIRVGKRSKVGTAEDLVHPDPLGELEQAAPEGNGHADHVDKIAAQQDHIPLDLVDDAAIAPIEDAPMDLGEPHTFEDPLNDEIAYSPALGPRPDDILFDLSDDGNGNGDEDENHTQRSESEVWAELDDPAKMQAFTPAPIPGEYDLSDEDDEGEQRGDDDDEGTEAIRAAILSSDAAAEEEEAAANGHGDADVDGDMDEDVDVEMEEVVVEDGPSPVDLAEGKTGSSAGSKEVIEGTTITTVITQVDEGAMTEPVGSDIPVLESVLTTTTTTIQAGADANATPANEDIENIENIVEETPAVEAVSTTVEVDEPLVPSITVDDMPDPIVPARPAESETDIIAEVTSTSILVDESVAPEDTTHAAEIEETATPTGNSAEGVNTTEATIVEGSEAITPIDNLTPAEVVPPDKVLEDTDRAPLDQPNAEAADGDVEVSQVPSEIME